MHKQTLEIEELAQVPADQRKNYVPIPDEKLDAVRGMNRKQRRAWLAQWRAQERKAAKGKRT